MNTKSKRPLLRGYTYELNTNRYPDTVGIGVHCPHCDRLHHHGYTRGQRKPEHRVAHCHDPESPFDQGGYYIAPFPKKYEGEWGK